MNPVQRPSDEAADLRAALDRKKADLEAAERELAGRRRELFAFERRLENRLGRLIDQLEALEEQIAGYMKIISEKREERIFGEDHGFKDPRYWRNWETTNAQLQDLQPIALPMEEEQQVKDLYRKLAREFHPDLADDDDDVRYLEKKMAELNEAYAAKNLAVLKMLAIEAKIQPMTVSKTSQKPKTEAGQLKLEMARIQRRLNEINRELGNLHNNPSVQLSLDVKLARREGRDLLREMAKTYKVNIQKKTFERDYLKAQLEQSGLAPE